MTFETFRRSVDITSLKGLIVAMRLLKTSRRLERNGFMADGLTYTLTR